TRRSAFREDVANLHSSLLFRKSICFADNLTSLGSSVGFFGKVSAPRQIPLFERVGKRTSLGRETLRGMPVLLRDLSEQHLRSWSCPPRQGRGIHEPVSRQQ